MARVSERLDPDYVIKMMNKALITKTSDNSVSGNGFVVPGRTSEVGYGLSNNESVNNVSGNGFVVPGREKEIGYGLISNPVDTSIVRSSIWERKPDILFGKGNHDNEDVDDDSDKSAIDIPKGVLYNMDFKKYI